MGEADLSVGSTRWGGWSFGLFVTGVLGPFVIALIVAGIHVVARRPMSEVDPTLIAVWFALAAEVLAFALGWLGRGSRIGRVGLWGSGVLLGLVLLNGVIWFFVSWEHPAPAP